MFIPTGPAGFETFTTFDSSILLHWTASSVTPTLKNPFYTIDKNDPQPCTYYGRPIKETRCTINDVVTNTEHDVALILCDRPSLENNTVCTSPSRATSRMRPQGLFYSVLTSVVPYISDLFFSFLTGCQ